MKVAEKSTKTKFDIYEHINNVVIEGLQKEGLKWFKSWADNEGPINLANKTRYNGINIFWLNWVCLCKDYKHNQWLTFKQITDLNGKLKKGEKSTEVFLYQVSYFHKPSNKWYQTEAQLVAAGLSLASPLVTKHFTLRYFNVFNVAQVEGIEPLHFDKKEFMPIEAAEKIVDNYCTKSVLALQHKDASAYYSPKLDYVNMPKPQTFVDSDSYYKVLFHELAHSTGHANRLNREGITNTAFFGTDTYAKEELIAEIASMYLATDLGLQPKDDISNSQAYIKGWVSKLKDHKYECVSAMTQAAKAVEYIKQFNK
jgi:antirestriction protein ArdC